MHTSTAGVGARTAELGTKSDGAVVEREPVRCLLGMLGVDIHNKGIRTLARLLRDRGVEVIYMGEHNSPQAMARTALTEDVDAIGVSFSISSYMGHVAGLMDELRAVGADDIAVMVGGIIHDDDVPAMLQLGVGAVFGPGSSTDSVIDFLHSAKTGGASSWVAGHQPPNA